MSTANDLRDAFGNRMKGYEALTESRLCPDLPIVARIDGRAFHTFTRGMKRPFDEHLMWAMAETTKALVDATSACIGYTQSDEITIVLRPHREPMFSGRVQKLVSNLASIATAVFNEKIHQHYPSKPYATFDCRVFVVPNETEAANAVLWREFDATKNSISSAAQAYFSHGRLMGLNGSQKQDLLMNEAHINWNDYPSRCKRGTYIRRVVETRKFTPEELAELPEKHAARLNPDLVVTREKIVIYDMPIFTKVTNREDVIFRNADPIVGD